MRMNGETGIALAIIAAIVGAGFASGREIVAFFSCTGWASWLGIVVSCSLAAALTAMLCEFARRTDARSFPGIYAAAMGGACGDAVQVLHGMTMLVTLSVMLTAGGELGALALPVRHAFPLSMVLTLVAGLFVLWKKLRPLRLLGAILAPLICAYYLCLALDPTPAPTQALLRQETTELSGNAFAACLLGALYAALNSAMSGGVLSAMTHPQIQPRRLGRRVGLLLFCVLAPANAALLRAGEEVRQLALPGVVLAARWGKFGFYASIAVMWLSIVSTLAAALGSLCGQAAEIRVPTGVAACIASLGGLCLSVIGFRALVQVGYPLLGWACALTLLALLPFRYGKNP